MQFLRSGKKQTADYSKALGLYIHVPFCVSKCKYCDFYSLAGKTEKINGYVKAVLMHIKDYAALFSHYTVDTVYFGGGTPTYIGEKALIKILDEIKKEWKLAKNAEITVEANPESMNKRLLKKLKKAGVNRLSIGVQSANNGELSMLGRVHSFEDAKEKFALARSVGFDNIGLDLMYGLSGQDTADFVRSVEAVITLSPEHVSCYSLTLEPNTPMGRENPPLPDDDIQSEMYHKACEKLRFHGYEHYEISNFAKPGKRSRHNSKYWDLSEYLGLGPGAHSFVNGKRFEFVRDLDAYIAGVTSGGDSIVSEEEDVPTMQRHGEYIMLRLRTSDGVDEEVFQRMFHKDFYPFAKKLERLVSEGYVQHDLGRWSLTEKGFLVSNSIILETLEADD